MFVSLFRRYFLSLRCFVPSSWPPIFYICRFFVSLRCFVPSLRCRRFLVSICHSSRRFVSSMFRFVVLFRLFDRATTSCKNIETLRRKTTFLTSNRCWSQVCETQLTDLPPPFHSKMFLQVLSMQSSIAFSFDKGWREITSTRSWTDHLSQNTAQCLKIFCDWL